MASRSVSPHTGELTPEERRRRVAEILARGVLRYRQLIISMPSRPLEKPLDVAPTGLEVPVETRLSVSRRSAG